MTRIRDTNLLIAASLPTRAAANSQSIETFHDPNIPEMQAPELLHRMLSYTPDNIPLLGRDAPWPDDAELSRLRIGGAQRAADISRAKYVAREFTERPLLTYSEARAATRYRPVEIIPETAATLYRWYVIIALATGCVVGAVGIFLARII